MDEKKLNKSGTQDESEKDVVNQPGKNVGQGQRDIPQGQSGSQGQGMGSKQGLGESGSRPGTYSGSPPAGDRLADKPFEKSGEKDAIGRKSGERSTTETKTEE